MANAHPINRDEEVAMTFAMALRVTRSEARLLVTLYKAAGNGVPYENIAKAVGSGASKGRPASPRSIPVHISRIRKKIGHAMVHTFWGQGVGLTAEGVNLLVGVVNASSTKAQK